MASILVTYGTKHGQTKKIARAIEHELRDLGNTVTLTNVAEKVRLNLSEFDGTIVSAPVYAGKYQASVQKWIKKNTQSLSKKPSAFVSVCLGILEKNNEATQVQERKIVADLLDSCGWRPNLSRILPGALPYTKYNWLIRMMMKRVARKAGGDTDTSVNREYTDWDEVRRFAREFSDLLAGKLKSSA